MEEKLKSLVRAKVSRGKVDLSLTVTALEDPDTAVLVNRPLARGYLEALRGLGKELGVADDITLATLCRMNDIFMLRRAEPDEDALWDAVRETALEAISHYLDMRAAEGARLKEDIEERLSAILLLVARVEERSPLTTEEYRARLYNKLLEVLEGRQPDDQRILTEAAIFAEKTAVAEETVRLKSHVSQLREILSAGDAMGRKLDFLVQELNREANTVGSKCQDLEIARIVVDMKSEIEKIREQIQNIE
jgi:uncharacterized protein (TIGR00255 family)